MFPSPQNTCWTSSRSIKKVQNIKQLEQTLRLFTWTFYQVPIFRLPHATVHTITTWSLLNEKECVLVFTEKKFEGNGSCKFHDFSVHFVALVLYIRSRLSFRAAMINDFGNWYFLLIRKLEICIPILRIDWEIEF